MVIQKPKWGEGRKSEAFREGWRSEDDGSAIIVMSSWRVNYTCADRSAAMDSMNSSELVR